MQSQAQRAEDFQALHLNDTPLILANVWDPLSAAIVADAGLDAIATASASVALSRGLDDGEQVPFDELVQLVGKITEAVDLPVSVDFESGYAAFAHHVRKNASQLIEAGAVGVNIEDSLVTGGLRTTDQQCERITAVREAGEHLGVPVFINARTDVFIVGGDEAEAIDRLCAYVETGADGVYPIMCTNIDTLHRIHTATGRPINVLMTDSTPPIDALIAAGVHRLSMGPGLLSIAAGATAEAAKRLAAGDLGLAGVPRVTTGEMRRIQGIAT
ncbi:MAG: isocitrate lyase/phosphoenolpyruvate mutase family protein [bacterium]|nr:isocitrate lyase/phosphoenolpyruvate mutase family protein [bacterium]